MGEHITPKNYRFAYINKIWYLMVNPDEKDILEDFANKTDGKYANILFKDTLNQKISKEEYNIVNAINTYSRLYKTSLLVSAMMLQQKSFETKYQHLLKGETIFINENNGFFTQTPTVVINKIIYLKNLVFPNYTIKDIKVSQWGKGTGFHYYAHVGTIEVRDGDIVKWDTFDEAYQAALEYVYVNNDKKE